MICRDRLYRLLRFGRKNGGSWDEGEDCECSDPHCVMLDDGDVDRIIQGLQLLDAQPFPSPDYQRGQDK